MASAQKQRTIPIPKAIFFDMDGVLFDSMPLHYKSWATVFSEVNIAISEEAVYLNEGRTGASTITEAFINHLGRTPSDAEIKSVYAHKTALMSGYNPAPVVTDMPEVVNAIKQRGVDRWIVTGSGQSSLLDRIDRSFPSLFSSAKMVTGNDVVHGKPHPEPYLMAWEKSGYKKEEVMVIENAPLGVKSAVAAGITCIAINTGILQNSVLEEAGANMVIPSAKTLLDILF